MAPLPLTSLSDKLRIASVTWDIVRFDEHSGIGSGHDLQAEMAKPKWTADITLSASYSGEAKQVAAILRSLQGSQNSFLLTDPTSTYPQADPLGTALGGSAVQVHSIGDGKSLRLKGLPSSYVLTTGDKGQINFGTDRTYFFEIGQTATASGGVSPMLSVFPDIPVGIAVNQVVILAKPACKMILVPGSHNPGTSSADHIARGASFKAIERR